jgi:hypothetical protein
MKINISRFGMQIGLVILGASLLAPTLQGQSQSLEDGVRQTIRRFQKGVEAGDKKLGPVLASKDFAASFIPFFNSLADVYSQHHMTFPVEIGHVKVLKDGRAKVETFLNPGKNLFVFTLVREEDDWKVAHLEGILFPVFDIPALPASSVLELPPDKVRWMRAEYEMAFNNRVFYRLKEALGEEQARRFFEDGVGFRAAVDAWLPFLEGAVQFAVFYGILEENYYGSKYIITRAADDEAEIRFAPLQALEVLKIAVFWPKMPLKDFQALYADIMKNRAAACGLNVQVVFNGSECTLTLKKLEK